MLHHSISDIVSFLQHFYLTDFAAVSVILMCFDSTSCIHFDFLVYLENLDQFLYFQPFLLSFFYF